MLLEEEEEDEEEAGVTRATAAEELPPEMPKVVMKTFMSITKYNR